jgi:HEAT repeat protein
MRRIALTTITLFVLLGGTAVASEAELLAKVRDLQEEGTKWFNVAGNTDLSPSKRNEARKKAYWVLKQAYYLLDDYVTEHPERMEAFEERMVKIHMMTYWIRKESPLGLLKDPRAPEEEERPKPKPRPRPEPGPEPRPEPGPGPRPEPRPEPGPGPRPGPGEGPGPTQGPEDAFKAAERYERKNPADVSGALERYREFMARFPDPDSGLFSKALERSSVLNSRLKDAYRELRQEDPDALDPKRILSPSEKVLVVRLTRDLKESSPDVRRRAAIDLGLLGSGEAAYHLVNVLKKEKDPGVAQAIRESLVKIGGKRTTEQIEKLIRERTPEGQLTAIQLLLDIGRKHPVQGRYAGIALAAFVHSRFEEAGRAAFDALKGLGRSGGVDGLMEAVREQRAPKGRRLALIDALGNSGEPRAATALARFLVKKGDRGLRDASIDALKRLGVETVPYLIPFLSSPQQNTIVGWALRQITGMNFSSKARLWDEWWKRRQSAREAQGG